MRRQGPSPEPRPSLPPRPNPGPELEPHGKGIDPLWLVAIAPPLALLGWWAARRRKLAPIDVASEVIGGHEATTTTRLVLLAEHVREALARRFGPAWGAKTTEEITEALASTDGLAADHRESLLRLLREADCEKFSDRAASEEVLDVVAAGAEGALAALAADGVRSIQNGR